MGFRLKHTTNIGRKYSLKRNKRISVSLTGRKFSEKHKEALRISHIGYSPSEETKKKMSKSRKGKISPAKGKKWKWTDEQKLAYSKLRKGLSIKPSEESKRKNSEAHRGNKSFLWQGGISFKPYSIDWTKTLKKSIRERDKYTCRICNKEPSTYVHHIDYNKENCEVTNLITLCPICHSRTNVHRNYWINYFKDKI